MTTSRILPSFALSSLLGLAACAAPLDAETSRAESAETAGASVEFRADGSIGHAAAVVPVGGTLVVTYDVRRLVTCGRLGTEAVPPVMLELFYMTRRGHTHIALGSDWVDGAGHTLVRATIGPFSHDDAGDLQLWFRAWNGAGCEAWDSAHGHNFHFTVGAPDATPSYAAVAPLIEHACARCHHDAFATLDRVKAERSEMAALISEGAMPRGNPDWKDSADGRAVLVFLERSQELR